MSYENDEQILGEFDFHKALLYHINRISKLITSYPVVAGNPEVQPIMAKETREFIEMSFHDSVELLEAMLYPYLDDKYQKDVEERKATWKDPKYKVLFVGLDKYGLLLKLMDRLNLLLDRGVSGEIK